MSVDPNIWSADWQQRLRNRLRALGYESLSDYLDKHPAEPYVAVARTLGEDVAAMQLSRLHIQEVSNSEDFRRVAMDSLAREITSNLPSGWQLCSNPPKPENGDNLWRHLASKASIMSEDDMQQRIEFQTSGVYAYWVVLLQKYDPEVETRAFAVWNALKSLSPPAGWLPKGPNDAIIMRAFDLAWPTPA